MRDVTNVICLVAVVWVGWTAVASSRGPAAQRATRLREPGRTEVFRYASVELGEAASNPSRFSPNPGPGVGYAGEFAGEYAGEYAGEEGYAGEDDPRAWESPDLGWDFEGDPSGEIGESPGDDAPPAVVDFLLVSWLGRDRQGRPVSGTFLVQVMTQGESRKLMTCGKRETSIYGFSCSDYRTRKTATTWPATRILASAEISRKSSR